MSFSVYQLVLKVQFPNDLCRRYERSQAKLILLSLADDCGHDGTNACTAVRTIAAEAQLSIGTIDKRLRMLDRQRVIHEQIPPSQHFPRTWALNLPLLASWVDPDTRKTLKLHETTRQAMQRPSPDSQHVVCLESTRSSPSDSQSSRPDSQDLNPDSQSLCPDTQHVADELIELSTTKELRTAPAAPHSKTKTPREEHNPGAPRRFVAPAKTPSADGNYRVVCRLVGELLETGRFDDADFGALKEAAKVRCGELHIDYGRNPDVDLFVIDKAIASEWWKYRARCRPATAERRNRHS
jgi:hypothetical protein